MNKEFDDFRRRVRRVSKSKISPARAIGGAVAIGIVLLVVIGVLTTYYTVGADERGVIRRFGRHVRTVDPGLHFKLPFGLETLELVKVDRVWKMEFGFYTDERNDANIKKKKDELLMLTGDQNMASIEWIVQYKIVSPEDWIFKVAEPEETIRDVSVATMALVVGDASVTEVLTARRQAIGEEVKRRMQTILDGYECGIEMLTVELQDVTPPPDVRDSFNEVNQARQEKDTMINKARAEYLKAVPTAEGEAQRIIQEAEGFKIKRVNEAHGDVAKFEKLLAEYERSKDVTRSRLYLEAMSEVLPKLTRVYVIDDAGGAPLKVLDLDAAGAAAVRTRSTASTSRPPTRTAPTTTRREPTRSTSRRTKR